MKIHSGFTITQLKTTAINSVLYCLLKVLFKFIGFLVKEFVIMRKKIQIMEVR